MTPAEFRTILSARHWSASGFAKFAGYAPSCGFNWASGRYALPEHVAEWLRRLHALGSVAR